MKPVIEVNGISKSYQISHQTKASYDTIKDDFAKLIKKPFGGGPQNEQETFWALKDIDFEVKQGESFGIIGKNGSGKSTLLKILSRIVDPTAGTIKIHGKVTSLLEVGTGFHPELTGRENIYFNGSMIGMSKQEITKKFDEIVAFSEVEKFLDTPVKFYSSGMFVRLAFSVAAHLDSEILILDEVLSVGDASFQKKSLDKMENITKEGRTILFVSHSMGAVRELCTRGLLLNSGGIEYMGDVDELVDQYTRLNLTKQFKTEADFKKNKEESNDHFRINDFYLSDGSGKRLDAIAKSSDEILVTLDLEVRKAHPRLVIGYIIETESKVLLYSTYSADHDGIEKSHIPEGKIRLKGSIPKHLLNEGSYKVSVIASIFNESWIYEPRSSESPSIHFGISMGLAHEKVWKQPREGFLAPEIEWRMEVL